jgi:hypothetical protein
MIQSIKNVNYQTGQEHYDQQGKTDINYVLTIKFQLTKD